MSKPSHKSEPIAVVNRFPSDGQPRQANLDWIRRATPQEWDFAWDEIDSHFEMMADERLAGQDPSTFVWAARISSVQGLVYRACHVTEHPFDPAELDALNNEQIATIAELISDGIETNRDDD